MFSMLSLISAFLPLVTPEIVSTKYGDIEGLVTSYVNSSGLFQVCQQVSWRSFRRSTDWRAQI